ncbi:MAG: hypothetical protein KGI71_03975 [Patescibacteria group bacterium]|nr:hypothetical protein [Patescibacteria group bacterium]
MNEETEILTADSGTLALLNKGEIDMQISTAHKYPRSVVQFRNEVLQMVTLNEKVAGECIYALPRDGKTIEGPSARFAEVVASAWGNGRAGARVVSDQGDFVTAQGVFHDLQRNVAITYEVQRRITNKAGKRFGADMIAVTANAACSIALRNAILKGIPKAFWADMYDSARQTAMGDVKTLANRRADALAAFLKYGVSNDQVFAKLGIAGAEDITLEHLLLLRGMLTAIKDGDTTPEQAFAIDGEAPKAAQAQQATYPQEQFDKALPTWLKAISEGKKTADQIIAMAGSKHRLTEAQQSAIKAPTEPLKTTPDGEILFTYAQVADRLQKAASMDALAEAGSLISAVGDSTQRGELTAIYERRAGELA